MFSRVFRGFSNFICSLQFHSLSGTLAAAVARTPLAAVTNNTNAAAVARTPMSAMSAKSFGSSAKPPTAGAKRSKAARRARQQATKKAAGGRGGVQAAGKLRPPVAA